MSDILVAPPPWTLKGSGYIILYKSDKSVINNDPFLDKKFKENYKGGFSCIMIVDYTESNVSPYSELLFMPGKFSYMNKNKYTISKIYVSTQNSIVNGQNNWAIPKEMASFKFEKINNKAEKISATVQDKKIFELKLKKRLLKFPVNTRLLPFPLVQEKDNKAYFTSFKGSGKGRWISVSDMHVDPQYFPDISYKNPIIAIKIQPFTIQFPIPKIIDIV